MKSDPKPVPEKIEDRTRYVIQVTIEGARHTNRFEEGGRLAQKLTGVLAREFPDRWSSASFDYFERED